MRLIAPLLAAAVLAGCGLKDDLYLPPPQPAAEPAVEPAEDEPADEQDHASSPDPGAPMPRAAPAPRAPR